MRRRAIILAWLGLAAALGGCTTDGQDVGAFRQGGATLAFESIDGPPPQVFDRMVSAVNAEAQAKSVAVVSRAAPASYRVRAYLAAQLSKGRTVIAWVWDVYDRDQQRAVRLSGEEPAGKPGRDAWNAADDRVIQRIAQAGMAGVAGIINGTVTIGVPEQPADPATRGPAVAGLDTPAATTATRSAFAFNAE